MHKIFTAALMATIATVGADACTNIIVGRQASSTGAVFCSYNADSYGMYGILAHYAAGRHDKGEMRQVVDWDSGVRHGAIPEAEETYNVVGNMNEWQLTIAETTYGGREEMVDTTGILDYGSLIYITLQRCRTAREAIKTMTTLAETYGYCSEGETFSICDPDEAWIMEMMGRGAGSKGVVWVALRVPDDAVCAHANQSRIGRFDMKDKQNTLFSKDVVKFAREKGWFSGRDEEFSWKDAFAKPDFEARRFCDARVWSIYRRYADMSQYEAWALGEDPAAKDMPLWIVPNKKVTREDVMDCMRDHYEGTALSVGEDSDDLGGGIWQMPYRPTPLTYKIDGQEYFNERPISTQQTAFTMVAEMRKWMPRQVGGVLWFGNDDANMVAFTPVYCSARRTPTCYNAPGADELTFSDQSAFWLCNMVSNIVYPRYSTLMPELLEARKMVDARIASQVPTAEKTALALMEKGDTNGAIMALENLACEMADGLMMSAWRNLLTRIVVRYNDMTIRPVDADGNLQRGRVLRPGYPEGYARRMKKKLVTSH